MRQFTDTGAALRKEERLLDRVAQGLSDSETVLWTGSQSLVAPRSMRRHANFALAAQKSAERGWPVELRPSGGGVVPQGPGILNLALIRVALANRSLDPIEFYTELTELISRAVAPFAPVSVGAVPGSYCDGKHNLVVDARKLAGTAQRWTRRRDGTKDYAVLAHATILCSAKISEACAVINAFYEKLGHEPFVKSACHVNFSELVSWSDKADEDLAERLHGALTLE